MTVKVDDATCIVGPRSADNRAKRSYECPGGDLGELRFMAAPRSSHCARHRTATGLCSSCQPIAVKFASRSTNRPSPVTLLLRAVETLVLQGSAVLGQSRGRELTHLLSQRRQF